MLGGAWLFAAGTVIILAILLATHRPIATTTTTIASTTINGRTYNAIGLSFYGVGGAVLLGAELLLIATAIILTLRPATVARRVGHVILVGWSALWLANAIWLLAINEPRSVTTLILVGGFMGGLFMCTAYRAWRGWPAGRGSTSE